MKIEDHARRTKEFHGIEGTEIHEWIDAFFNMKQFRAFLKNPIRNRFNPYDHRRHRHYIEILPEAKIEFRELYTEEEIEKVVIQHLKDDYKGYVPKKADFDDPEFKMKYHRLRF